MIKEYIITLNYDQAKRFKAHLHNMGVSFSSGECGGFEFVKFSYKENEIADIKTLLDEVKCHCWAENVIKNNK